MPDCNGCDYFTKFYGEDGTFGVAIYERGRRGFNSPNGDWYEAMGIGHCEHPHRPRGLVLCAYSCRDHSSHRKELRDITPKTRRIE